MQWPSCRSLVEAYYRVKPAHPQSRGSLLPCAPPPAMSANAATSQPFPRAVVRLTPTTSGVRLYFPPLRAWRFALRLALAGIALLTPALIARIAFAPSGKPGAAAMLTLVLTAAF